MAKRRGRPRKNPTLQIKILDKTFQIIELFSIERPCWNLVDVIEETGLPKTTAHRILSVLQAKKFFSQDTDSEQYRLGPLALQIGQRAMSFIDIRRIARPVLNNLSLETRETAALMMLSPVRDSVICTLQINNNPGIRLMMEDSLRIPLHAGGSAKVILAFMHDEEIERALSGNLEKLTNGTITERIHIEDELERIRKRGYAMSLEEISEGAAGIAMPISDGNNEVIGSVGIFGPVERFRKLNTDNLIKSLKKSVNSITNNLGG